MNGFLSRHPSTAVAISIVALVMATVGTGYAAFRLPKGSVGTKQLKKHSVSTGKIRKNAVTGAKVKKHTLTGKDINVKKLGIVPAAETAGTVPPREGLHVVGAANEPGFAADAGNLASVQPEVSYAPASFFKDHDDVVHLEGIAKSGSSEIIFTLPPGFRPAPGVVQFFETTDNEGFVAVFGSNVASEGEDLSGVVAGETPALLSGISFRAGS